MVLPEMLAYALAAHSIHQEYDSPSPGRRRLPQQHVLFYVLKDSRVVTGDASDESG